MSGRDARESLIDACRREAVTLFVGAGVAHSRGMPLWNDVVRRMVEYVAGEEVAARVMRGDHPLEPQLALEWVEGRLREKGGPQTAKESFASLLRRALYENVDPDGHDDDALSAVSRAVRSEHEAWPDRRLVRIVTLNADDLLERTVCADGVARLVPIARPNRTPEWSSQGSPPPIPVYHVHGYLPEDADDPAGSAETLVFTDDQFWSTTASPLSFANRVVANALHDSQCVFVGISMRDVNLMRWLAMRYEEVVADARAHGEDADAPELRRHFWIHSKNTDPTGVLTEILRRRGVHSVEIPSWEGAAFSDLLAQCFSRSPGSSRS